jgi:hypothetical protein
MSKLDMINVLTTSKHEAALLSTMSNQDLTELFESIVDDETLQIILS